MTTACPIAEQLAEWPADTDRAWVVFEGNDPLPPRIEDKRGFTWHLTDCFTESSKATYQHRD